MWNLCRDFPHRELQLPQQVKQKRGTWPRSCFSVAGAAPGWPTSDMLFCYNYPALIHMTLTVTYRRRANSAICRCMAICDPLRCWILSPEASEFMFDELFYSWKCHPQACSTCLLADLLRLLCSFYSGPVLVSTACSHFLMTLLCRVLYSQQGTPCRVKGAYL